MKKLTFVVHDGTAEKIVVGDLGDLLEYIESYAVELVDGEDVVFKIERHDMTEDEIEAIPYQL